MTQNLRIGNLENWTQLKFRQNTCLGMTEKELKQDEHR